MPDTFQGARWYFGANNRGGIHINCGVQNFWFFLLSQGGIHNGVNVQGVGVDDVASIAYYSVANFIQNASQYADAREAAILSARIIYGICSPEHVQTTNAWAACGIGNVFAGCNVNISGPNEACVDLPFTNYTYTATDITGSNFTWNFPPQWTATTSGAGNNTLTVSDFGYLPPYLPYNLAISVTSSTGGTDVMQVTLDECDIHRGCTESLLRIQAESENVMLLSPNPANDQLTINFSDTFEDKKYIKIVEVSGKVIFEESVSDMQQILDIHQLPPGLYYIKVTGNNYFQTTSFIKL